MTNFKTITGAMVWVLTSCLLMLAALEPVSIQQAQPSAYASV